MDIPASLSFGQTSITASEGQRIPLDIQIYTGNETTVSADVYITYDENILEITPQIDGGDIFSSVGIKPIAPGRAYVYGLNVDTNQATQAEGTMARIYFQAISSGKTTLHIDCAPFSKQTSQIISGKKDLPNIIHCDSTRNHTTTITVSSTNVLGSSTQNVLGSTPWYIGATVLVLLLTIILWKRYRKLTHELTHT